VTTLTKAIHNKRDVGEIWVFQVLFYRGVEFGVSVMELVGGNGTVYSNTNPWTAHIYLDGHFIGTSTTHLEFGTRIEVDSITIPHGTSPGKSSLKVEFPQDGGAYAEIDIFVCDQDGTGCEPRIGQGIVAPHLGHVVLLQSIPVPTPTHFSLVGDGFPVDPKTGKSNGTMWVDRSCGPNAPPTCVETGTLVQNLVFQASVNGSHIGQFGGFVILNTQDVGPGSHHYFEIYDGKDLEIKLPITNSTS